MKSFVRALLRNRADRQYTLIIGSGVSREAQIPTGQELMRQLLDEWAERNNLPKSNHDILENEYRNRNKRWPTFDSLMTKLEYDPSQRETWIRDQIDLNSEDLRRDKRIPTATHRFIARLVEEKFIRAIITTNFDDLIERALHQRNIVPVVVKNDADAKGSHQSFNNVKTNQVFVIKVNGDYLFSPLKMTRVELEKLEGPLGGLVSEVLKQQDVAVVGWSGDWDRGLADALRASRQSATLSTYWFTRDGDPPEWATDIPDLHIVQIEDAQKLFAELILELGLDSGTALPSVTAALQRQRTKLTYQRVVNDTIEVLRFPTNLLSPDSTLEIDITGEYDPDLYQMSRSTFDQSRVDKLFQEWPNDIARYLTDTFAASNPTFSREQAAKIGLTGMAISQLAMQPPRSLVLQVRPLNHLLVELFNRSEEVLDPNSCVKRLHAEYLHEFMAGHGNLVMGCPSQLFLELALVTQDDLVPIFKKQSAFSTYGRRYNAQRDPSHREGVWTCGIERGLEWPVHVISNNEKRRVLDIGKALRDAIKAELNLDPTAIEEYAVHAIGIQHLTMNSALLGYCRLQISSSKLRAWVKTLPEKDFSFKQLDFVPLSECSKFVSDHSSELDWHGTALIRILLSSEYVS